MHEGLWRVYSALGHREGYDHELVLREVYHIEKAFESDARYAENNPDVMGELKFLVSTENRLEEAEKHLWGARILPDGTDPQSVAQWRIPDLPDDGVERGDKFKALDEAISSLQEWERGGKI